MKTIDDVIRWLENDVEWTSEASEDAANDAIAVLKAHQKTAREYRERTDKMLDNPIFSD